MSALRKNESGQAIVLMALSLFVLIGMAALVLDVGSWYHTKRQLQATADASALAGAQALPERPGTGLTLAMEYADKNGGRVLGSDVAINYDTITVTAKKTDAGVFSGVFGIAQADIDATATAIRGSYTGWSVGLAPWVIDKQSVDFGNIITFKVASGDQASSGNFGGVDLPVKEKSCVYGKGGNDYYDLIAKRETACGVKKNELLPVEPGNKAATGTALDDRGAIHNFNPYSILTTYANGSTEITNYYHPNVVVIPVIEAFHQGSSAPFNVLSLAWFIISDYDNKTVTGMFVRSGAPADAKCPTAGDPNASCPFGAYDPDGFSAVKLIK
jgi:Putative Flp pilus-assembly TadE/G-like